MDQTDRQYNKLLFFHKGHNSVNIVLTVSVLFQGREGVEWDRCFDRITSIKSMEANRIFDGVEVQTRKFQASFQIIKSYARLAEPKT